MTETNNCWKCGCDLNDEVAFVDGDIWCHSCADNAAEAAYDRQQEALMAGDGPLSLLEQQREAYKIKRGLR